MRRLVQIVQVTWLCHACGEQVTIPVENHVAANAFLQAHRLPAPAALTAVADCDCTP